MCYERGIIVHPEDLTVQWLDWMEEANLNLLGLHPVGGIQAHLSLQQAIDRHAQAPFRALLDNAQARGIQVEYEAHVMRWLLPEERFSAVPEWFRMDENGLRVPDFNACASNREALAYIAEKTALLARLLATGSHRYLYWLDDVKGCYCHCPQCMELSPSDQQLAILNAMLEGLRSVDSQASLCYIAYHDALKAPQTVRPADGIFLEYAPIEKNHHRAICDPHCPTNVQQASVLPDLLACFGSRGSRVLEYWMDNSLFSNWTKPPKSFVLDESVMRQDVSYYRSLGFETLTSFGCYLGPDYQALYGIPPLKQYGVLIR